MKELFSTYYAYESIYINLKYFFKKHHLKAQIMVQKAAIQIRMMDRPPHKKPERWSSSGLQNILKTK
jgi:hypothetical protein